jgi:hypothetical protein
MTSPYPHNPSLLFSFLPVGTDPVVTGAAQRTEVSDITQPLPHASSLVVQVIGFVLPAPLAKWMVGKIFLLQLVILSILVLTLFGCEPEPALPFYG